MAGAGFKTFVDGNVLTASEVNTYLMQQAVMVFADASARSTAITAPSEGMVTYLTGSDVLEYYDGAAWQPILDQDVISAKGDLIVGTADDTVQALTVGSNEQRLVADSGETTGLKYVADTTNYAIGAKGDLLVGTAADTLVNLAVGTNGHVLTADSGETSGVKWAAAAGGGGWVLIDTASPSAAASVSFDNVFTSTYRNYVIVWSGVASSSQALNFRLRASSTDISASNYNLQGIEAANTSVTASRSTSSSTFRVSAVSPVETGHLLFVYQPQLSTATVFRALSSDNNNAANQPRISEWVGNYNAATAADGFTLYPTAGNITGSIAVYGMEL